MERNEAIDAGEVRYFTGRRCKHGHLSERWALNGMCVECQRMQLDQVRRRAREAREARDATNA